MHDELADWLGNVPLRALADRGARAVRYLNRRESPGSISLAIDPQVIMRVRTIQLPVRTAAVPSVDRAERAVADAVAALREAEQLKPDASGDPRHQVFDSELSLVLADLRGTVVSDEARRIARQMKTYTERQNEIRLDLRTTLAGVYLTGVNQRLRNELIEFIALESELKRYHQQMRALAGLIAQPDVVVQQLAAAPWRTVRADEPPPP
ncbi:hypothetical protein GV791_07200 [Nocardia cyriacigeorgica]|uniref:Uncharacterized protein n=1 Tax=Nocardia cyriacigeorgica TaxID=135487 RepID=A0A6P1CKE4_9NOCA|nr:hypothetical protein [Nocardia cyriacigeorgica]NEW32347.1 hypothetical protein [Nocardia cyriacigeorgica]